MVVQAPRPSAWEGLTTSPSGRVKVMSFIAVRPVFEFEVLGLVDVDVEATGGVAAVGGRADFERRFEFERVAFGQRRARVACFAEDALFPPSCRRGSAHRARSRAVQRRRQHLGVGFGHRAVMPLARRRRNGPAPHRGLLRRVSPQFHPHPEDRVVGPRQDVLASPVIP